MARSSLLILLCTFFWQAQAQYKAEEFQASVLQAKFGAVIVFNGQRNAFTLKIVSKQIEETEQENFLLVDKKLVQASVIPFTEKFNFNALDEKLEKELLTGYKEYEKEFVQQQLNTTLTEREEFLNLDGTLYKYWSFDMPKDNASVVKQVYLFTICFDQILILNGPVLKDQNELEVKTLLVTLARTLERFPNKVFDLRKLYFDLQN